MFPNLGAATIFLLSSAWRTLLGFLGRNVTIPPPGFLLGGGVTRATPARDSRSPESSWAFNPSILLYLRSSPTSKANLIAAIAPATEALAHVPHSKRAEVS